MYYTNHLFTYRAGSTVGLNHCSVLIILASSGSQSEIQRRKRESRVRDSRRRESREREVVATPRPPPRRRLREECKYSYMISIVRLTGSPIT